MCVGAELGRNNRRRSVRGGWGRRESCHSNDLKTTDVQNLIEVILDNRPIILSSVFQPFLVRKPSRSLKKLAAPLIRYK
jgi:hypothetical protein